MEILYVLTNITEQLMARICSNIYGRLDLMLFLKVKRDLFRCGAYESRVGYVVVFLLVFCFW